MASSRVLLAILLFTSPLLAQQKRCYFQDRTLAPDAVPCDPNATHSHCCGYGHACLSNGLCYVSWDMTLNDGACTDSSWESKGCYQPCRQKPLTIWKVHVLRHCPIGHGEWCCGEDFETDGCCREGNVFNSSYASITNGSASPGYKLVRSSDDESRQESNSSEALSNTPVCAARSTESDSPESNHDVAIGAGVGVPLGLALLGTLFLYFRERRRNRFNQSLAEQENSRDILHKGSSPLESKSDFSYGVDPQVYEVQSPGQEAELHGSEVQR